MSNYEIQIQPKQLLAAICQELTNVFFGQQKAEAKQAFNKISSGESIPLIEISSNKRGDVQGVLALDHSEFNGKLNFSAFRDCLGAHLHLVGEKLKQDENLNIFTNEETGDFLFNIPGILEREGTINVILTGIEQRRAGEIIVKLMFINPDNYLQAATES